MRAEGSRIFLAHSLKCKKNNTLCQQTIFYNFSDIQGELIRMFEDKGTHYKRTYPFGSPLPEGFNWQCRSGLSFLIPNTDFAFTFTRRGREDSFCFICINMGKTLVLVGGSSPKYGSCTAGQHTAPVVRHSLKHVPVLRHSLKHGSCTAGQSHTRLL